MEPYEKIQERYLNGQIKKESLKIKKQVLKIMELEKMGNEIIKEIIKFRKKRLKKEK